MLNQERRVVIEKLKWRSRRSQLELDLIFTKFINGGKLHELSAEGLLKYAELLELDDSELLLLFQQKITVDDGQLQLLIDQIKHCTN